MNWKQFIDSLKRFGDRIKEKLFSWYKEIATSTIVVISLAFFVGGIVLAITSFGFGSLGFGFFGVFLALLPIACYFFILGCGIASERSGKNYPYTKGPRLNETAVFERGHDLAYMFHNSRDWRFKGGDPNKPHDYYELEKGPRVPMGLFDEAVFQLTGMLRVKGWPAVKRTMTLSGKCQVHLSKQAPHKAQGLHKVNNGTGDYDIYEKPLPNDSVLRFLNQAFQTTECEALGRPTKSKLESEIPDLVYLVIMQLMNIMEIRNPYVALYETPRGDYMPLINSETEEAARRAIARLDYHSIITSGENEKTTGKNQGVPVSFNDDYVSIANGGLTEYNNNATTGLAKYGIWMTGVNLIDHWLDPAQEALLQGPRNALLLGQAKVITSEQNLMAAKNDAKAKEALAASLMHAYNGRVDLIIEHLRKEGLQTLAEEWSGTVLNVNYGNSGSNQAGTSILLPEGGGGSKRNEQNKAA